MAGFVVLKSCYRKNVKKQPMRQNTWIKLPFGELYKLKNSDINFNFCIWFSYKIDFFSQAIPKLIFDIYFFYTIINFLKVIRKKFFFCTILKCQRCTTYINSYSICHNGNVFKKKPSIRLNESHRFVSKCSLAFSLCQLQHIDPPILILS